MKNIFVFTVYFFIAISCKAQTIVPLSQDHSDMYHKSNTYTKDVDNEFDKYTGTWKFQQGNTTLTIVFKKIIFDYYQKKNYYEDLLIGEYKYIENGIEKVNTLSILSNPPSTTGGYNIYGNRIVHRGVYPQCPECLLNEKRVILFINDSEREYLDNAIVLRYKNENGTEKIIAKIFKNGTSFMPPDNAPDEMRVPYGEYVLIKQP